MQEIFQHITYREVIDRFLEAENYIYLAAPGLFEEWSQALLEAKKQQPDLDIQVIIDPTEDGFRKHYGEVHAIAELEYWDIPIKEYKNHRLGFIITEKEAFFLFNHSRAIEKEVQGYNAIKMSAATKAAIGAHCFGVESAMHEISGFKKARDKEVEELEKINEKLSSEGKTTLTPDSLNKDEFDHVAHSLEQNPSVSPDFKRLIIIYSTKIKFVEFSLKGIKISNRSVVIPNQILQLVDDSLRDKITTRMDIFDDELKAHIEQLTQPIQKRADDLRGEYLHHVSSRNKNVMKAEHQKAFEKKAEALENDYKEVQIEIKKLLDDALQDVRNRLFREFHQAFTENPTPDLQEYEGEELALHSKWKAEGLTEQVKIPKPAQLADSFDMDWHFFDPTFEDLRDEDLIEELYEQGFISEKERNHIVSKTQAIGVQPEE